MSETEKELPFTPSNDHSTVLVERSSEFPITPMRLTTDNDPTDSSGRRFVYAREVEKPGGLYAFKPTSDEKLERDFQDNLRIKFNDLGREYGGLPLRGDKIQLRLNGESVEVTVGEPKRTEAHGDVNVLVEVADSVGNKSFVPLEVLRKAQRLTTSEGQAALDGLGVQAPDIEIADKRKALDAALAVLEGILAGKSATDQSAFMNYAESAMHNDTQGMVQAVERMSVGVKTSDYINYAHTYAAAMNIQKSLT